MAIPRTWSGSIDQTDLAPNIVLPLTVFQPGALAPSRIGHQAINKSGSSIPLGSLVYVNGWDTASGFSTIALAASGVQGARAQFMVLGAYVNGLLVPGAIANNAVGALGVQITLTGQNTNAGNVGDPIYRSATPGAYTLTKPTLTFVQQVGNITVKSATVGMVNMEVFQNAPFIQIGANELIANLAADRPQSSRLIAVTGTTKIPIVIGKTGSVGGFRLSPIDALAASDTNYISFSVVNVTQSNTMTLDNAGGRNTTKATGGAAIVADTAYSILPVTPPSALLTVAVGDQLNLICAVTGTLANTVYLAFSAGEVVT